MPEREIPCKSLTYALKGHKILLRKGINNTTKKNTRDDGCSYFIYVRESDYDRALSLLRENGVTR